MSRCLAVLELSLFLLGAGAGVAWAEKGDARSASDRPAVARPGPGGHDGGHGGASGHVGHRGHVGRPYRHPHGYPAPFYPGRTVVRSYPYSYGYGYSYPPHYYDPYYYYPPPLYIPAEELYGPQSVMRFMGVDHWFRPRPNVNILVTPKPSNAVGGSAAAPPEAEPELPGRATNAESLALAWKFIGYGDAHFATQKYVEANARYRKAARAAPQLADSYFRQGYAYLAMGRYDLAAAAVRRGLGLSSRWPKSAFSGDEIYGDNELAKNAHLDALAKAAEEDPTNADLPFLLGVFLHFDDQPDRAKAFFERAIQLAGGNDAHVRAFLD